MLQAAKPHRADLKNFLKRNGHKIHNSDHPNSGYDNIEKNKRPHVMETLENMIFTLLKR